MKPLPLIHLAYFHNKLVPFVFWYQNTLLKRLVQMQEERRGARFGKADRRREGDTNVNVCIMHQGKLSPEALGKPAWSFTPIVTVSQEVLVQDMNCDGGCQNPSLAHIYQCLHDHPFLKWICLLI